MGWLSWIIFGAFAGWVASSITGKNKNAGLLSNVVVGVLGASIGGFIFESMGNTGVTGFNPMSFLVAVVGSVVLLLIINLITGRR